MPPAGFEPAIPASERLQTHALDRSVTGIGSEVLHCMYIRSSWALLGFYIFSDVVSSIEVLYCVCVCIYIYIYIYIFEVVSSVGVLYIPRCCEFDWSVMLYMCVYICVCIYIYIHEVVTSSGMWNMSDVMSSIWVLCTLRCCEPCWSVACSLGLTRCGYRLLVRKNGRH